MWKSLVDVVYPIGSLYFTTSTINPSTLFGGTWKQVKDKFILSAGDLYVNGATGESLYTDMSLQSLGEHLPIYLKLTLVHVINMVLSM